MWTAGRCAVLSVMTWEPVYCRWPAELLVLANPVSEWVRKRERSDQGRPVPLPTPSHLLTLSPWFLQSQPRRLLLYHSSSRTDSLLLLLFSHFYFLPLVPTTPAGKILKVSVLMKVQTPFGGVLKKKSVVAVKVVLSNFRFFNDIVTVHLTNVLFYINVLIREIIKRL